MAWVEAQWEALEAQAEGNSFPNAYKAGSWASLFYCSKELVYLPVIVGIMFVGGIDANINVSVGMEGAICF